ETEGDHSARRDDHTGQSKENGYRNKTFHNSQSTHIFYIRLTLIRHLGANTCICLAEFTTRLLCLETVDSVGQDNWTAIVQCIYEKLNLCENSLWPRWRP